MVKITFIRHAQSRFNSGEVRDAGLLRNCSLSAYGVQQCDTLEHEFDLLIISPLKRAIQTYANSRIKARHIIINPLFREHKSWEVNLLDFEEPEYETDVCINKRMEAAMQFLRDQPFANIGVISHHDFLHMLLRDHFGKNVYLANLECVECTVD